MGTNRKLRRTSVSAATRKEPPVLIVKPHRKDYNTCEHTNKFIMACVMRGIAEELPFASMSPELARNQGIKVFLNDKHYERRTHILFLDDDTMPDSPFAIDKLLGHNKPVVSGVTPIIREGINENMIPTRTDCYWNVIPEIDGNMQNLGISQLPNKLFQVKRIGGSCVLVRRDVLEKLKPPYQKFTYNDDNTGVKMSEDIYFSEKIHEAGYQIWADPTVLCHHYHNGIDILEIFHMLSQANKLGLDGKKI